MSTNPPESPRPALPTAVLREVAGLLLLLFGPVLIVVAAYRVDVNLGLAVTGLAAAGVGLLLTTRRRP